MSSKVLATRYLKAYSNCFLNQERSDALHDLKTFCNSVISSDKYWNIIVSPVVTDEKKQTLLKEIPFLAVRPFLKNLVLYLNLKKRLSLLKDISSVIDPYILDENNQIEAKVFTPVKLSSEQVDKISVFLKKKTNKTPVIEQFIDESIIAGIKVVTGHTTYDGTIINALKKLKLSFN